MSKKKILIAIGVALLIIVACGVILACCSQMDIGGCAHTYGEGDITKEPNCTNEGIRKYTCSKCGDIREESVPALGHVLGEWVLSKSPTPYEEGEERSKCANCRYYESRSVERLSEDKHIAIDDGNGGITYREVGKDGSYTLEDPERLGYSFKGWVDVDGKEFASSGSITSAVLIKAVWEIDGTDTLEELVERAGAGVADIKITANIAVNRPVFVLGNTRIYSDGDYSVTRAEDYDGDIFVIGQNESGIGSPILGIATAVSFGGGSGTLTIDGCKDSVTVDVVGSALFISDSATVNIFDGVVISNHKKVGNSRVFLCEAFLDSDSIYRAGGSAILLINGTVNMYGGIIENNEVLTEYTIVIEDDGSETSLETAGCGGAIYTRGNFNMYGGYIRNNSALRGGAIYNDEKLQLLSGYVSFNKSYQYGGAVSSSSSATAEMFIGQAGESSSSMVFEGNYSVRAGGVLYSNTNSPIVIYGNTLFINNLSESSGGAIYTGGSLTVRDAEFLGNSCVYSGGAIYHHFSNTDRERRDIELTDCVFENNTATSGGAVILSAADTTVKEGTYARITNCAFNGNHAVESESGAGNGGAIYITRYSDAIIIDSAFNNNNATTNAGAISVHSGATVTIRGGGFGSNVAAFGGAMYISSDSEVSLSGTYFLVNSALIKADGTGGNGGAIYASKVELKMEKVELIDNSADNNGGACYLNSIFLSLDDATKFESNSAKNHGGALYATYSNNDDGSKSGSTLNLSGTVFSGNTALAGGAISARSNSVLNINGASFIGNSTPLAEVGTGDGGGAIYSNNSTLNFTDVKMAQNSSGYYGGALKLDSCNTTIENVEIAESVGGTGGAMYVSGGSLQVNGLALTNTVSAMNGSLYLSHINTTLSGIVAEGNSAYNGGAIYVGASASLTVEACSFSKNEAKAGGAIYTDGGSVTAYAGNSFSENKAKRGGAIDAVKGASISIGGITLENNVAEINGGAIFIEGATLTLSADASFCGNRAEGYGGAIYVGEYVYIPEGSTDEARISASVTVSGVSFTNNSASRGGAIYVIASEYSLTDVCFTENRATDKDYGGGAIYNSASTATIINVTFRGNTSHKGGAVALHSDSSMKVSSIVAGANSALANESNEQGFGGVFYLNASALEIVAGEGGEAILGGDSENANTAVSGGAIYATSNSSVKLCSVGLVGNTADVSGGAICIVNNTTLNLEGGRLSNNSVQNNGGAIYSSSGTVVIGGSGTVLENNLASTNGGAIYASSGSVTVGGENTVFNNNSANGHGGAIYLTYTTVEGERLGATLTVEGGIFSENSALSGGAISGRTNSNITLSNTVLRGNSTPNAAAKQAEGGGAIYVNNASLSLSGAVLEDNLSGYYGGAVRADSATVSITGNSRIASNSGVTGAAIYTYGETDFIVDGLTLCDHAGNNAVIYLNQGKCSIKSLAVTNNKTEGNGIIYFSKVTADLSGITASGNEAKLGGVIYARMSVLSIADSSFDGNKASNNGGAISLAGSELSISGESSFTNNSAEGHAGAIYVSYYEEIGDNDETVKKWLGVLRANGASFENNSAMGGGAVSVRSNCEAYVEGCSFKDNSVSGSSSNQDGDGEGGGAIYVGYGYLEISSSALSGNSSDGYGGAINAIKSNVSITDCSLTKNEATVGGAVYARDKTLTLCGVSVTESAGAVVADNTSVKLSGEISISENESGNVTLLDGAQIILIDALSENSRIGVTSNKEYFVAAKSDGEKVTDISAYTSRFFHDGGDPLFINEDGYLAVGFIILEQPSALGGYTVVTTGAPTYAWYAWIDGEIAGDALEGQTSATLTDANEGELYACVVTNNGKSLTTSPVIYMKRQSHPLCKDVCDCEGIAHESLEWIPVTSFAELKSAISLGGNYFLATDIVIEESITVTTNVNLCLNGKKLSKGGENSFSMLVVKAGAALALTDCGHSERVGYIDPETGLWVEGAYTGEGEAEEYTLYGGVITGGYSNLGGVIYSNGNIELYNVNFAGNSATNNGGAIDVVGGTLTASGDVRFVGNTAVGHAGAIYVTYVNGGPYGSIKITDGVFAYNRAMGGGAISIRTGCEATLEGTSLIGNASAGSDDKLDGDGEGGGAIYVGYGKLTLKNATFTENLSEFFGGAVNIINSVANISGGTFEKNTATSGGAISIKTESEVTVSGTLFKENYAKGKENTEGGGAINSYNSSVVLSGVTMEGNGAGYYGGAITARKGSVVIKDKSVISGSQGSTGAALYFRETGTDVTLTDCTVSGNVAKANGVIYMTGAGKLKVNGLNAIGNTSYQGGVFYVSGGEIDLDGVVAVGNNATAGGVLFAGGATVEITDSTLGDAQQGNSAERGAVIYSTSGSVRVTDTDMFGNSATEGGAIFVTGGEVTLGTNTVISDNEATDGGAVYANGGAVLIEVGALLEDNRAENGGAITAINGATVSISGATLQNNTASVWGGAVFIEGATLNVGSGSQFKNNTAGSYGGAIYVNDYVYTVETTPEGADAPQVESVTVDSTVNVDGATFEGNSALRGGAIYVSKSNYSINNSRFFGNIATEEKYGGGAIYSTESYGDAEEITLIGNSSHKGGAIALHSRSRLTVSSMTATGNSATLNGEGKLGVGSVFYVNNSTLELVKSESGTIAIGSLEEGSGNVAEVGGAIYIENASSLVVEGAVISGNESNGNGGAIYASASTVELDSVSIIGNSASGNGGAIYLTSSVINARDSIFENNSSANGGAIYSTSESKMYLVSVTVTENESLGNGGAISAFNSVIEISGEDTEFSENRATGHGGAIYLSYQTDDENNKLGSSIKIEGGSFLSNTALAGGAISARSVCSIDASGTVFTGNSATGSANTEGGGALYANDNTVTLKNVTMNENTSAYYGGAIAALNVTFTMNGGNIQNNVGTTGAAIEIRNGGSYIINEVTLSGNVASGSGVLYITSASSLTMSGLTASGNSASNGGVLYISGSATVSVTDSAFTNNSANGYGGAIDHRSSGKLTVNSSSFVSNTAGNSGGAISAKGTGEIVVNSCTFEVNSSLGKAVENGQIGRGGGAIYVSASSKVSVSGGSFSKNSVLGTSYDANLTDAGGAIMVEGGSLTVSQATFAENSANNGGAIGTSKATTTAMNLSECNFSKNTATSNGGAIFVQNYVKNDTDSIVVSDSIFTDNTANTGGIAYVRTDGSATFKNISGSGNSDWANGSIYATTRARITLEGDISLADDDCVYVTGSGTTAVVKYRSEDEKTAWQNEIKTASSGTVTYTAI